MSPIACRIRNNQPFSFSEEWDKIFRMKTGVGKVHSRVRGSEMGFAILGSYTASSGVALWVTGLCEVDIVLSQMAGHSQYSSQLVCGGSASAPSGSCLNCYNNPAKHRTTPLMALRNYKHKRNKNK
ncbi:hypothetical protein J6590_006271 [Homalodisca vitripennis]|nr:hypothetical protein J6590_006271 [Homalodisca vitripennis]